MLTSYSKSKSPFYKTRAAIAKKTTNNALSGTENVFLSVDGTSTSAAMRNVNTTASENLAFVTQEAEVEVAPDDTQYNSGDELDCTVEKQDGESTNLVCPNFLSEPRTVQRRRDYFI